MLWPFSRSQEKPQSPPRGTIEAIYGMIVAQTREPAFYLEFGVPDTVDGRFDLLVLHLWMVLRRLRESDHKVTAQALFDHFCADMDDNLREMGVSDTRVPKRMEAFGEAFYGRGVAYDAALDAGETELRAAFARNILNSDDPSAAERLARYAREAISGLSAQSADTIAAGRLQFPHPADVIR